MKFSIRNSSASIARISGSTVAIGYIVGMANHEHPTINDFLARLYTIRDDAGARAKAEANAVSTRNAARGLLRSGATLKALAELIEKEFDAALGEMLATLRRMKSVPDIDYQACRDQAFLRARDLLPVLRGAADRDKWIDMMGRGTAGDVINKRVEDLLPKIDFRFRQFDVGLDQVGVTKADVASPAASPVPPAEPPVAAQIEHEPRPYQVALSFAGEQREYVRDVARALAARHVAVFYDEFQANTLWGKDGAEHFHQIYSRGTQYVVMFISAEYVAKAWTRQERCSAVSRQMKDEAEYILPVRFDDTAVPGLPDTIQYLSAGRYTPVRRHGGAWTPRYDPIPLGGTLHTGRARSGNCEEGRGRTDVGQGVRRAPACVRGHVWRGDVRLRRIQRPVRHRHRRDDIRDPMEQGKRHQHPPLQRPPIDPWYRCCARGDRHRADHRCVSL
ncbi:TIR domain-containing protein [Blastomonas aquatica]|uniref:TIR domain-containing protein n=1 Tax=Blastomonas aquatica TaxID=1510276 RepID=UPI0016643D3F|nr:TIR domain-containing protein [Blastomonas aquatica]